MNQEKNKNYYKNRMYAYIALILILLSPLTLFNGWIFLSMNLLSIILCVISIIQKKRFPFLYVCMLISTVLIIIAISLQVYALRLDSKAEENYYIDDFYSFKELLENEARKNNDTISLGENSSIILFDRDFKYYLKYPIIENYIENLGSCEYYVIINKYGYNAELSCKGKYSYETPSFNSSITSPKCESGKEQLIYTDTDINVNNYNNIAEYLEQQENLTITLSYYPISDDGSELSYELSQEEREQILMEMKSSKISSIGGFGFAGGSILEIKYTRNNEELHISFVNLRPIDTNDGNLVKIMDNLLGDDYYTEIGFCNYSIENIGNTVQNIVDSLKSRINNN